MAPSKAVIATVFMSGLMLLHTHKDLVVKDAAVRYCVPCLNVNFLHQDHLKKLSFPFGELRESIGLFHGIPGCNFVKQTSHVSLTKGMPKKIPTYFPTYDVSCGRIPVQSGTFCRTLPSTMEIFTWPIARWHHADHAANMIRSTFNSTPFSLCWV